MAKGHVMASVERTEFKTKQDREDAQAVDIINYIRPICTIYSKLIPVTTPPLRSNQPPNSDHASDSSPTDNPT